MPSRPFISRFPTLYLATLAACLAVSLLALGVTRVEVATSAGWMTPTAFSQLLSLHRLLLESFVMATWAPACLLWMLGDDRPVSRQASALARATWLSLLVAVALMLFGLITATLDDGWALAATQPSSDSPRSSTMIVGLLFAHASLGGLGLLGWQRARHAVTGVFARAASALIVAGAVVGSAAAIGAVVELWRPMAWLDPGRGGHAGGLALAAALFATWTKTATFLASLGIIATARSAGRTLSLTSIVTLRRLVQFAAAAGAIAFVTYRTPDVWSTGQEAAAWLAQTIFVGACLSLVLRVVRMTPGGAAETGLARTFSALACVALAVALVADWSLSAPFGAWLSHGFADDARTYVLGAAVGMTTLTGIWHALGPKEQRRWSPAVTIGGLAAAVGGLATALLAMLVMSTHGLALDMRRFPSGDVPFQVAVLYGGALLVAGVALITGDIATRLIASRRRQRVS